MAKKEELLVGTFSGVDIYASRMFADRPENKGEKIAVMLSDTGECYSTMLYNFAGYAL